MSAMSPHSKRETRRSSRLGISFGGRSLVTTICLLAVVERVEGVEELLLRALLAGEKLDVVDQEQVDVAIALLERRASIRSGWRGSARS